MKTKYFFVVVMLVCNNYDYIRGQGTGFVTIDGQQFKDGNGNNFYPVVCNYLLSLAFVNYSNGTADFVLSPNNAYGVDGSFEYGNGAKTKTELDKAYDRMLIDFNEIKSMGFNTIRVLALLERNYLPHSYNNTTFQTNDFFNISGEYPDAWNVANQHHFLFESPLNLNSNAVKLIAEYQKFMLVANNAGLKVILVSARGIHLFQVPDGIDIYAEWLTMLGTALKNEGNLLAYDLVNEPEFSEQNDDPQYTHSKQEVCDFTQQLYTTLKDVSVDPNHLITIGGGALPVGVVEWDPAIMKIDFWAPHIYPYYDEFDILTHTQNLSTINNLLAWQQNFCPMPWLIGETGFVSGDPKYAPANWPGMPNYNQFPYVDGDETDQQNFAAQTLSMVRNGSGSGYSWWDFQHLNWYCPPVTPGCNTTTNDFHQNNFGLLKAGEPIGATYPTTMRKQLVQEFDKYLDPQGQPPLKGNALVADVNYGNPFFRNNNSNNGTKVSGTVEDQDGNPIEGAVVYGWNFLKKTWNQQLQIYDFTYNLNYTFSHNNGYFELSGYNYNNPNNSAIVRLMATGFGIEKYEEGLWQDIQMNQTPTIPPLKKITNGYDAVVNNVTVDANDHREFIGWNTITASNVQTQGTSQSIFVARNEVNIKKETHFQSGSEVHVYNAAQFPDCNSLSYFVRISNQVGPSILNEENVSEKDLELDFGLPFHEISFSIFPNPTKGLFTIVISNSDNSDNKISITNNIGKIIYITYQNATTIEIDACTWSKGIYFIQILNATQLISKKIIIN